MNYNTLRTTKIYNIKTNDGKRWKVQEQQEKYISAPQNLINIMNIINKL